MRIWIYNSIPRNPNIFLQHRLISNWEAWCPKKTTLLILFILHWRQILTLDNFYAFYGQALLGNLSALYSFIKIRILGRHRCRILKQGTHVPRRFFWKSGFPLMPMKIVCSQHDVRSLTVWENGWWWRLDQGNLFLGIGEKKRKIPSSGIVTRCRRGEVRNQSSCNGQPPLKLTTKEIFL